MKKTLVSLALAGAVLFSGCSLLTLETNPEPSVREETAASAGSLAETTVEATSIETEKPAETTVTESSETVPMTTEPSETAVPGQNEMKGKVVILATGGTIAGVGDAGKSAGYKPGTLTAEDLISAVPELADVAEIEAIQVCNVNSDDITDTVWIELANRINELSKDPEIEGFVITHGTDTMEETA